MAALISCPVLGKAPACHRDLLQVEGGGYRQLLISLHRDGQASGIGRVERLYRKAGMMV